ncbi:MAG: hypothetical protein ACKOUM_08420, partial [Sphingopyxis sp.]
MTGPHSISTHSAEPGWGRATIASLPQSLMWVDGPGAAIALIDGRGDWAGMATALLGQRGTRAMVVLDPAPPRRGGCTSDKGDGDGDGNGALITLANAIQSGNQRLILPDEWAGAHAMDEWAAWLGTDAATITIDTITPATP